MNHVAHSLYGYKRSLLKIMSLAFVACVLISIAFYFLFQCNLPGGMSDQGFHIKADGRVHELTGYINSDHAVATIIYDKSCAVKNNTPSRQSLIVARDYGNGQLDTLATGVRYEAKLKGGLYEISTVLTSNGETSEVCQVMVRQKNELANL